MPKKLGYTTRQTLISASLPAATDSYTVISHAFVIDTIEKTLANHNFTIESEEFKSTSDAQIAYGVFVINYGNDPDLKMMYSFSNSYNKIIRFRAGIGAQVSVNKAHVIAESDNWHRKHTGTADEEAEKLIEEHVADAKQHFQELIDIKNAMKGLTITKAELAGIVGELFFDNFLTVDQVSLIAKEYDSPSFQYADGADNLWTCYNHVLRALRDSHPKKWLSSQIGIHMVFLTKFNLLNPNTTANDTIHDVPVVDNGSLPTVIDSSADSTTNSIEESSAEPQILLPGFTKVQSGSEVQETITPKEESIPEEIPEEIPEVVEETIIEAPVALPNVATEVPNTVAEVPVEVSEIPEPVAEAPAPIAEVPEEVQTPVATEEEAEDSILIQASEFPGIVEGDTFEMGDEYVTCTGQTELDGSQYLICEKLNIEVVEATTTEVVEETATEVVTETVDEVKPEPIEPILPTGNEESIPPPVENAPETVMPDAMDIPETIPEDIPEEVVTDVPVAEDKVDPLSEFADIENDTRAKAIAEKLEELYGYLPQFNYTIKDDEYNIVLESDESLVLAVGYIHS